jgi:adenine/guanine phosphoribosyltransferase-like PRPP-binding protein
MRVITEPEFAARMGEIERELSEIYQAVPDYVTGPGRSGAIAAVYASHILRIPFVPFKSLCPGSALIVDTARESGRTIRKAAKWYYDRDADPIAWVAFEEPPRVAFWYEAPKPQWYRHERRAA